MKKKTGCRFCDKQPIAIAVWWREGKPVHFFGVPQFKGYRERGTAPGSERTLIYEHSESQTYPCTNPAYAEAPEGA